MTRRFMEKCDLGMAIQGAFGKMCLSSTGCDFRFTQSLLRSVLFLSFTVFEQPPALVLL